jgi:glutamine amidotransferase
VHSYYAEPATADLTLATTDHGIDFAAIVHKDNLWATQFHPEKSQKVGERLLDNFGRV